MRLLCFKRMSMLICIPHSHRTFRAHRGRVVKFCKQRSKVEEKIVEVGRKFVGPPHNNARPQFRFEWVVGKLRSSALN